MLETSKLYKTLLEDPLSWKEFKVTIAGEDYLPHDRIVSMRTSSGIFSSDTLSIGGAISGTLDLTIRSPGSIPKMAEIKIFFRLTNGSQTSEWLPRGVYYIDTRQPDNEEDTLTIQAFDAMLRGEEVWEPDQSLVFPMNQRAAAMEMARLIGVEFDNPEDISTAYYVDYPTDGYTERQILRFIGAANGGNFIITWEGKLRFIGLNVLPEETFYLVTEGGKSIVIGGVRILVR